MRDDDDLPVLDAIVRGGDRAVILSTRLELALDPSRDARPRPPPAPRAVPRSRGLETDDVARIDLGRIDARRDGADGRPVARVPDGPIDIDANRGPSGGRASRRLADPPTGHRPTRAGARRATSGHAATGEDRRGTVEALDDTLALDDLPLGRARARARATRPDPPVSVVPPAGLPRRAVAANDRGAGPAGESPDIDRMERLVDEIVERHVATLRRDVRAALERALRESGTRRT